MKPKNRFFSTYSKIMISQYPPLTEIIKANAENVADDQKVLSAKQINEVLNGPYGSFTSLGISAYAVFNKLISGLNLMQDTLFKTKRVNIKEEIKLPDHLKNYPLTRITALEKNLSKLLREGYKTWQVQLEQWKNELQAAIKNISFPLSEIEAREFQSNETITSILNQFTEFKIDPPKVNLERITIHDYLMLKVYLAIHNSLARRQCPSTTANIMDVLKKLSSVFSNIMKKEKQILQEQKKEIEKLIRPIQFK